MDVTIFTYLYFLFSNYDLFLKYIKIFQSTQTQLVLIDKTMVNQLFQIMMQSLKLMLFLAASFHAIIYLCYLRELKYAYKYIKLMSWVGSIGLILMALTEAPISWKNPIFFIVGLLLLFVANGLRRFPHRKKKSTAL